MTALSIMLNRRGIVVVVPLISVLLCISSAYILSATAHSWTSVTSHRFRDQFAQGQVVDWRIQSRIGCTRIAASKVRRSPGESESSVSIRSRPQWVVIPQAESGYHWATTWAFGWPLRSLSGAVLDTPRRYATTPSVEPRSLIFLKEDKSISEGAFAPDNWNATTIPVNIIWRGLLINSLLVSFCLWLIMFLYLTSRAVLRVQTGRCAFCGYPLGPQTNCSECGCARIVQRA